MTASQAGQTEPGRARLERRSEDRVNAREAIYLQVLDFLNREAELLDHGRFDEWLKLLTDDIVYQMPVRVTRNSDDGFEPYFYFDENHASIAHRIRRLTETDSAWAENPPSRVRRFVTNVGVYRNSTDGEWHATSYLLLLRNRWDNPNYDILSAEREDVLREEAESFRLVRRMIYVDQTTLGTPNLSVFL